MSNLNKHLLEQAGQLLDDTVALRREIHKHPELGLDLPQTKAATLKALEGIDLDYAMSEKTSGFVATMKGAKPGPTILLRGDMDALPMPENTGLEFASQQENRMHACGHDTHTAMLASAVKLLDKNRADLAGSVKFMFQPGEEGYGGAKIMMEEGVLEAGGAPDAAFAIHIMPNAPFGQILTKPGPMLAAADTAKIKITGRGGHGSMPHDTLDPVPVLCEIVQALQTLVTRRFSVFDPVVVTVGMIRAGTASNVIPEHAELEATVRSTTPTARKNIQQGIRRVATQIAAAYEMTAEIDIRDGYPPTVNHTSFVDFLEGTTKDLLGEEKWHPLRDPIMGAEDFSYVLQKYEGAMAMLGVGPDGDEAYSCAPCHSNRMHVHEAALVNGVALHAAVAFNYLNENG